MPASALLLGVLLAAWGAVPKGAASDGAALRYQAPDECKWVATDGEDVALLCHLRTINSELENTNFSVIQPQHTVRLRLECSEALFFQSSLTTGSFRPLVELRELSIEYCKIGNLSEGTFKGLCELRNLTVRTHNTDWSAMSLEVLPGAFSDELGLLEHLDLGLNNMWRLPEAAFCPLYSLESLNLTRNRLRDVSGLRFSQCGANLRVLDLSHNAVDKLPAAMFSGLGRLLKLYLHGNGMAHLADRAFEGLASLSTVQLSDNRLVNLPPELFADTRDIKEVYLQNNSINVLAPGLFSELTQLLVLDMSRNDLSADWVNAPTFAGLVRLVVLDISHNRISKLEPTLFRDLYSLQILRINDNLIEAFPPDVFAALYNLHTLIVSNNRLSVVESFAFNGLYVLSLLSMDNNRIASIHRDALKNCSSLQDLHLNGNKLVDVPSALSDVPMLRTLDLGENLISVLRNDSFRDMQQMYGLRLTENNIVNVTRGSFEKMTALKILNLSKNKIRKVEPGAFDANINLQAVRLDGNFLSDIEGLFMKLPSLVWLNISDNHLEWFDYAMIPTGLQWLDIHANKITELGNYFEIESSLSLSTFDASSNKLKEITGSAIPNSVEQLFLNGNLISKVQSYTFFKKPNLTRVDLFGNKITHMDQNSLRISAVPPDKPLPEFYIGGNPYECDCTMDWLQKVNRGNRAGTQPKLMDMENVNCKLLFNRGEPHVRLVDVAPYQFLCKYEFHCFALCHCCDFDACDCEMTCPRNCTCYHDQSWAANVVDCSSSGYSNRLPDQIPMDVTQLYLDGNDLRSLNSHAFIGRKRLKVLFMNNSNIDTIQNRTFNGLNDLEVLHLDANRLEELKGYEFDSLSGLRELFLQHNRIGNVHKGTFGGLRQLRTLRLDHNEIVTLFVWQLPASVTAVSLSSNPWSCSCEHAKRFREWMLRVDCVVDASAVRCYFNASDRSDEGGFLVDSIDAGTQCTGDSSIVDHGGNATTKTIIQRQMAENYLPLLTVTLGTFVIVLVSSLVVFVFRQELRVWLHAKFGVRMFYRADSQRDDRDKLFDAFVSYSSKDEAFVVEELAPVLEHGQFQYKLCLHYRDFPVGAFLADTVVQAVESSKRTIMVLSENFIKSEWCRFEFKSAHHQVLRNRRKRLIVILLGEVPQKDLDPDIRLYLKTNTFLQWGDKLFWQKLRFALPDVAGPQRAISSSRMHYVAQHHRLGHDAPQPSAALNSSRTTAIHI